MLFFLNAFSSLSWHDDFPCRLDCFHLQLYQIHKKFAALYYIFIFFFLSLSVSNLFTNLVFGSPGAVKEEPYDIAHNVEDLDRWGRCTHLNMIRNLCGWMYASELIICNNSLLCFQIQSQIATNIFLKKNTKAKMHEKVIFMKFFLMFFGMKRDISLYF